MIRNNNQNGRRRGRGVRPPQAGGGPSGNYNNGGGNRIDVRQRGNATQLLEKYKAMARDATQNGDRVQAEFYMQYADHYYRVLNEFRARDPQSAPRQNYDDDDGYENLQVGQNCAPPQAGGYTDDSDDDDGDEDTARREPAQAAERGTYDRQTSDRQTLDRQSVERQQPGDRQIADRPAGDRSNDRQTYDRNRGNGDGSRPQQRAYNGQRDNPQRDGNYQRDGNTQREGSYQRDAGVQRDASGQRDGNNQRDGSYQRDGNGQRDSGTPREAATRDAGTRDAATHAGARDAAAPDDARSYRDEGRANGIARVERTARPAGASRRDGGESTRREAPAADAMPLISGLPGPATFVTAAATVPVAEPVAVSAEAVPPADVAAEVPAPRRRGRPRKVVPVTEDAVDI